MINKRHHVIPYVIFVALLMVSLATFLVSIIKVNPLISSIASGVLILIMLLFVLANLQDIYLRRTNFVVKLIFPWVLFLWFNSVCFLGGQTWNNIIRAVCFQCGCLLIFLCYYIQGVSCSVENFKANQRVFFVLTIFTVMFYAYEYVLGKRYTVDYAPVGFVLYLTMLLPWIALLNNKMLRYVLLAILSCLALFSLKRSVLIQISIGGLFYVLIQSVIEGQRKRTISMLVFPFALIGLWLIISYVQEESSGMLFERLRLISRDRGSGRLDIWAILWDEYKTWPFLNQIAGKGYYVTQVILKAYEAHNDFIESLLSYGAIGFLADVCFSFYLLFKAIGIVLRKQPYAAAFTFGVISFWIVSLVSYNLYLMIWSLYLLAFLGYICGIDQQEKDIYEYGLG